MSFVFPVLLGGLIVISVPVLLHLIMRQKPKTLLFPAFRFLLKRHRTNLTKLRLRHLLLLVLRVLLITLICLAVTRPRAILEQLNVSKDRPVAAILLFDTSYSMEYTIKDAAGSRTLLDEAKKRGLELLNELPEGSKVAILDTAENVPTNKGEWLTPSQARERIKNRQLRYKNYPVSTRLETAYRLFASLASNPEDAPGRHMTRFLCVFSDRTRGCWDPSNLPKLHEASDRIPPPLERLQKVANNFPALIDLLQPLRARIPAAAGKNVPEQSLIEYLQKVRSEVPSLDIGTYPEAPTSNALAGLRAKAREVLEQLQRIGDDVPKENREYRDKLVGALKDCLHELRGTHAVFVDVGQDNAVDLGITELELPRQEAQDTPRQVFAAGEVFVLHAILQATGQDFSTDVSCLVDGKPVAKKAVTLKAGEQQMVPFEIDCGQLELKPGPHQIEIRHATTDPMLFNNVRFATFAIREGRQVLAIADDVARAEESWQARLHAKGLFRCKVVSTKEAAKLDANALSSYAVVCLFCVAHPPEPLWGILGEYLQTGGGLIVIPGGNEIIKDEYNSAAAAKLLPGRFRSYEMLPGEKGLFWDWEESVYQHPILKPFGAWKHNKTIDFIQAPRWTNQFWDIEPYEKVKVVINYAHKDHRPALLERRFDGKEGHGGRVLLFTTPLDGRQPPANNFGEKLNSFYLVIANLATSFLAGDEAALNFNFITGQSTPMVQLPRGPRAGVYVVQGPGVLDNVSPEAQGELRFRDLAKPGNYLVKPHNEEDVVGAFSLNLPPEECSAVRVPVEEIAALFGTDAVVPVDRRGKLRDALKGHLSEPEELLPLLMMLLLFVLAVENLLANKFYRREPEAPSN
jgi:hypothetical protein